MKAQKKFMNEAIDVAKKSAKEGDYSVGAIIVRISDSAILAKGKTLLKGSVNPTAHAEVVAILKACKREKSRFLSGCILYSTHEPCPMCTATAIWAKMDGIVFGATIEDADEHSTRKFSWRQIDMKCKEVLEKGTPKLNLVEEFMREECKELFSLSK